MSSSSVHYWGIPTASVDWCESNYDLSPYLCESFNAISSLVIVAVGALGIWLHRRYLERRFVLAFALVSLVGIGSFAFHATMRREAQMLDELPMLYSALVMAYILIEDQPTLRFGLWLPLLAAVHGLVVTSLTAFFEGTLQFYLFHLSFGSLEFFCFYRIFAIVRQHRAVLVRQLFFLGMGMYAMAFVCWFADLRYCDWLSQGPSGYVLQLHAVWHILVSFGLYLLTLLVLYNRLEVLGHGAHVERWMGVIPYVQPTAELSSQRAGV